jgi:quercetin dioxygenase-like cupin family protein
VELGPGDSAVIPAGTRHAPVAGDQGALLVTAMPVGMRILPEEGEPRVAPWAG